MANSSPHNVANCLEIIQRFSYIHYVQENIENKNIYSSELRLWLQSKFNEKCKQNPRYSLRAFAKLLEMDPSSVSQILSGKRKVSRVLTLKILDFLDAHPLERKNILSNSLDSVSNKKTDNVDKNYQQITLDAFAVISDWEHYAILDLTFVEGFSSSPAWIAKSLGITVTEVKSAIERLLRLELLERKNGQLVKTKNFLTNYEEGFTSAGLKKLQRQILQKALDAIEQTPQEEKDITSMTMAINPKKLPQAKQIIKQFRRDLCEFLEEGKRTRVYHLGIQLYPVSKNLKKIKDVL